MARGRESGRSSDGSWPPSAWGAECRSVSTSMYCFPQPLGLALRAKNAELLNSSASSHSSIEWYCLPLDTHWRFGLELDKAGPSLDSGSIQSLHEPCFDAFIATTCHVLLFLACAETGRSERHSGGESPLQSQTTSLQSSSLRRYPISGIV